MAKAEEKFIPYFKIRWARRSAWTLEQVAYLSCGEDPDTSSHSISATTTNPISKRYVWLITKAKQGKLESAIVEDGITYYNAGTAWRLLKERNIPVDADMEIAFDHMWQAPYGVPHFQTIDRSVYRQAGKVIAKSYPSATKDQIAETLVTLPAHYNDDNHGHISQLAAHQIKQYLKGVNTLIGKPKAEDKVSITMSLKEVVENM